MLYSASSLLAACEPSSAFFGFMGPLREIQILWKSCILEGSPAYRVQNFRFDFSLRRSGAHESDRFSHFSRAVDNIPYMPAD